MLREGTRLVSVSGRLVNFSDTNDFFLAFVRECAKRGGTIYHHTALRKSRKPGGFRCPVVGLLVCTDPGHFIIDLYYQRITLFTKIIH